MVCGISKYLFFKFLIFLFSNLFFILIYFLICVFLHALVSLVARLAFSVGDVRKLCSFGWRRIFRESKKAFTFSGVHHIPARTIGVFLGTLVSYSARRPGSKTLLVSNLASDFSHF